MSEQMTENLPKSKLKRFLTGRRSSNSKQVVGGNEDEKKQLAINIVIVKKNRRWENTKREKAKRWTKWVELHYL